MPMLKRDAYIIGALRRIWRWESGRRECLKATSCVGCGKAFEKIDKKGSVRRKPSKDALPYADHIDPVCPLVGYIQVDGHPDWNQVYARMFNGALQAICGECHAFKTKIENKERKRLREEAK